MPETVEVLFGGTILENGQSLKYSKVMYINMFQNSLWMSTKKNHTHTDPWRHRIVSSPSQEDHRNCCQVSVQFGFHLPE